MAEVIANHHVLQFTKNVELLLQQKTPRFAGLIGTGSYVGKAAQVVLQFGEVAMLPLLEANWKDATILSDLEHLQRWIMPEDFAIALPITSQDQLRMISAPKSAYAESVRAAYARKYDDLIIAAATGDARTGAYNAMVNTALPASQLISDGGVGMNLKKLLATKEILDAAENDQNEERFVVMTSRQIGELLNTTEIKNADYNSVKALVQGQIDSFLGFKFVRSERLLKEGTNQICFAWVKSGLHCGQWDDLNVRMDERSDLNYIWQVYAAATLGAARTQEKKVVRIDCVK